MIEVIHEKDPNWNHTGAEATARGTLVQKHDVLAWGDGFGAVARFKSSPDKKRIEKAFAGLDTTRTEKR